MRRPNVGSQEVGPYLRQPSGTTALTSLRYHAVDPLSNRFALTFNPPRSSVRQSSASVGDAWGIVHIETGAVKDLVKW